MKEPVSLDLFHDMPPSTRSNRVILDCYLTRRFKYILLNAPRSARIFDHEITAALDRLGGLGGVW